MTEQPLVSVLMTAYNRERYISEAIDSVLNSTYGYFELIVVDDHSTDTTVDIARAYAKKDARVKVFLNGKNLGDYANRNKAASYATGKYLKYVDSDDIVYPESLDKMVSAMEQYPDAGFGISTRTAAEVRFFTSAEVYHYNFFEKSILDMGPSFVIIHAQRFRQLNGFKTIRNVSDFDMWLRLAAKYPVVELPAGLTYWREHESQEFRIASNLYVEYNYSILQENLDAADCPLTENEKDILLTKSRKETVTEAVKQLIKNREAALFFKVAKKYKFNIKDYLKIFA